jgi:hypothetical protein
MQKAYFDPVKGVVWEEPCKLHVEFVAKKP